VIANTRVTDRVVAAAGGRPPGTGLRSRSQGGRRRTGRTPVGGTWRLECTYSSPARIPADARIGLQASEGFATGSPALSVYREAMSQQTRWVTAHGAGHAQWYVERFRQMAVEGADLDGEARLLDAMLARGSRVLDAGCGPGRVGAGLAARGHVVVGVDADPELIEDRHTPARRWPVRRGVRLGPRLMPRGPEAPSDERKGPLTWVETRGIEPRTSCLQTRGRAGVRCR